MTRLPFPDLDLPSSAGDIAVELTGRDYLSYSAVSTYRACPLKYYFRYVAGLPEPAVSSSLVFGTAIHAAIEWHYRAQLHGNPAPGAAELLSVYQRTWAGYASQTVQFGKEEDRAGLDRLAMRMLDEFPASELAGLTARGRILGIEEELRGAPIPECPDILARIDLLVEEADAVVVTDFKTSRARWSPETVYESADQLLLYSDLVRPLANGKPLRLQFAVLTKTKTPTFHCHSVEGMTVHDVERAKRSVSRVWRAIQGGHFFPAPSAQHCGSCPFREPCRAWAG